MVISENGIKKSPSTLHLDNFRKVRKFAKKIQFLFMKLVKISNDFKEKVPYMSNTPELSRVVFTLGRIESDGDRKRKWVYGR